MFWYSFLMLFSSPFNKDMNTIMSFGAGKFKHLEEDKNWVFWKKVSFGSNIPHIGNKLTTVFHGSKERKVYSKILCFIQNKVSKLCSIYIILNIYAYVENVHSRISIRHWDLLILLSWSRDDSVSSRTWWIILKLCRFKCSTVSSNLSHCFNFHAAT